MGARLDGGRRRTMTQELRCPTCRVRTTPGARFCGSCGCALPSPVARDEDGAISTGSVSEPLGEASAPGRVEELNWAPPEAPPSFFPPTPAAEEPENAAAPLADTPEELVRALERWKKAVPMLEWMKTLRARPEHEIRSALAFFDGGRGPPPALVAWFSFWDGQRDNGCWEPGIAQRALPLAEALERRTGLLGLDAPWSNLSRTSTWLPLLEHASADVVLFVAWPRQWGLRFVDHECPEPDLDEWGEDDVAASLVEFVDEATEAWLRR